MSDLEKVGSGGSGGSGVSGGSGASSACGHFVGNHTILRKFWVKYQVFLSEHGGCSVDDG